MDRPFTLIPRSLDLASRGLNAAGSVWVLVIMLLVNADILSRGLINRPIAGTREIVEISIIGIVYLQLAWSLRCGRMTRSDMLIDSLMQNRPRVGHALEVVIALLGMVFMLAIAWRTWPELVTAWSRNRFHGTRGVFTLPMWPFLAIILVGTGLAGVQFLRNALVHAAGVIRGQSKTEGAAE